MRRLNYCTCPGRDGWSFDIDTELWVCARCRKPSQAVYLQTVIEFSSDKEHTFVTDKTANIANFVNDLSKFLSDWAEANGVPPFAADEPKATPAARKKAAAVAKAKAAPEPEEDENEDPGAERREELEGMTIAALRKIAIKAGFPKEDVATAIKADLVESIVADELENEEEAPEEDEEADEEETEEDEESEEGEEYTREDLEALTLIQLKKVAKDEYEMTPADYKGMDKDALISHLLGEAEEAEEEEEDEDEGFTEEDLNEMSIADLKGLAKENGLKLRVGLGKPAIIKALLA